MASKPPPPKPVDESNKEEDSGEDDYMSMTFTSTPSSSNGKVPAETSLQRRARLRREAEARSRPKSKAELQAEADLRREQAHASSLLSSATAKKSKGFAIMAKMGFTPGSALGSKSAPSSVTAGESTSPTTAAIKEPIRISVKDDRAGIGLESEKKRKLQEAVQAEETKRKRVVEDEGAYRERMRREREEARWEKQVIAAQKVCERMADERDEAEGTQGIRARRRKGIPVVFRGLWKQREEAEQMKKMRHDLEVGLLSVRLPTYDDPDEDEDDKKALGKDKKSTYVVSSEDLDEEDEELDAFNSLPADEKLQKVVEYLRQEHHYCFWCKFAYPDSAMEGCPGWKEEDHD
ncbi:hypothetical protein QBC35DRAFT_379660 [Podospora australis]|uniref:G-patch domain-containing protein n=1 Tax=Podospora australis TaxID=1536484 RepID=A0AAN6WY71_9PEZI|nr:hypothetical protein QBC35DRAFT_379660 [Podospora australis]